MLSESARFAEPSGLLLLLQAEPCDTRWKHGQLLPGQWLLCCCGTRGVPVSMLRSNTSS
jgi:hypothetical protein